MEGYELDHCIGGYAPSCYRGQYRAYSVTEPDGSRSTHGFMIDRKGAYFDLHRSRFNQGISKVAEDAGRQLIADYQGKINELLQGRKPQEFDG